MERESGRETIREPTQGCISGAHSQFATAALRDTPLPILPHSPSAFVLLGQAFIAPLERRRASHTTGAHAKDGGDYANHRRLASCGLRLSCLRSSLSSRYSLKAAYASQSGKGSSRGRGGRPRSRKARRERDARCAAGRRHRPLAFPKESLTWPWRASLQRVPRVPLSASLQFPGKWV